MMDKNSIPPIVHDDEAPSPRVQIAALVSDVQSLAQAEWDYAKARLSYSGGVARKAGTFALLAFVALASAGVGLILGLLLIVSMYFGPWIATGSVVVASLLAAVLLALAARNTARNLTFPQDDRDE
jgi:Putative Actinobacterial Holin-X, holin superfamily III